MNNTAAQTPAARTQRFSSKSLSMGSLGTDQARYVIPVYQRPYAWTSVQVSQLMQDLLDFYRSPDIQSTYSLGTIVCDEETPGVFSILDGQQRLTTIDLLLEEISRRLDRPANEKHKRIISAYRYLSGMEANCESPLPACTEQRNRIAGRFGGADLSQGFGSVHSRSREHSTRRNTALRQGRKRSPCHV